MTDERLNIYLYCFSAKINWFFDIVPVHLLKKKKKKKIPKTQQLDQKKKKKKKGYPRPNNWTYLVHQN